MESTRLLIDITFIGQNYLGMYNSRETVIVNFLDRTLFKDALTGDILITTQVS
jgi:hypothetical protein